MSVVIRMDHINDLPTAAKSLLEHIDSTRIVAFHGELGAGKTSFIKALCTQLGVQSAMNSPTFALVNEYLGNSTIYHFDLYRLEKEEELDGIGFDEYIDSGNWCFIEWPEIAAERLPSSTLHAYIHVTQTERYLELRT